MKLKEIRKQLEEIDAKIDALPEEEKERRRRESREALRTQWKPTAPELAAMKLRGQHI